MPIAKKASSNTGKITEVKKNQIALRENNQQRVEEWETAESKKLQAIKDWAGRLIKTKRKINQVTTQYKKLMLEFLSEAYSVFTEVEQSEFANDFYSGIRWELKEQGEKIQTNTPNAALMIRFVCSSDITTKSMSDYSKVLQGASRNNVSASEFADWVKHKTMTAVIEQERQSANNTETYADRLKRARIVVLRVLETREAIPLLSNTTTTWAAEKLIGREGLWLAIGTATRRYDRESFYADINLLAMLTPNIDIEIYIINQIAKVFVNNLEYHENLINEFEEEVWAEELWDKLINAGYEQSDKSNSRWADRQQASRFESR